MNKRDGVATILRGARMICRMVRMFGTATLAAKTTGALAAAVVALEVACAAFEALDNYPGEVDNISPDGAEDA